LRGLRIALFRDQLEQSVCGSPVDHRAAVPVSSVSNRGVAGLADRRGYLWLGQPDPHVARGGSCSDAANDIRPWGPSDPFGRPFRATRCSCAG
jgi:hypothetical protein